MHYTEQIIELARAGRPILLSGAAGTGKTMIARRIPRLLGPLADYERRHLAAEYDGAGLSGYLTGWRQKPGQDPWCQFDPEFGDRPFRAPHHTVSAVGLAGRYRDWETARAGEIHLARYGVLFLDDLPEFERRVIEILAAELAGMASGRPLVVASAMLCPCGRRWIEAGQVVANGCVCTSDAVSRYLQRVQTFTGLLGITDAIEIPGYVRIEDLTSAAG